MRDAASHPPGGRLRPGQVAQFVRPVVETRLEDLLVEARPVEAGGHGDLDVLAECVIRRRCPDSVGIESLVEDEPLENRLVVQEELVADDGDLAQSCVGAHLVQQGSPCIPQFILQLVEIGISGFPGDGLLEFDRDGHAIRRRSRGLPHDLLAVRVVYGDGSLVGGFGRMVFRQEEELPAVQIRAYLDITERAVAGRLQPDRLPDACGAGIGAAEGIIAHALLAAGLQATAQLVGDFDDQMVALSGLCQHGDVEAEGVAGTHVASGELSVDEDLAVVVHRPEVQQHTPSGPRLRHRKRPMVIHPFDEIRMHHAGESALRAEGHGDLLREAVALVEFSLLAALAGVKLDGPDAVEVQPGVAHELRTRIFGTGNCHGELKGSVGKASLQGFRITPHNVSPSTGFAAVGSPNAGEGQAGQE